MRGNIDTRIEKLKKKEFDAIVLSFAGLTMLNLKNEGKCLIFLSLCIITTEK